MKEILFSTTLLALLVSTQGFTQLQGGIRVGASLSNLKYKVNSESFFDDAKIGGFIGAYLTAQLIGQRSLQPELYYSLMGAKDRRDMEYKTKLGYLTLPVLLRYNINKTVNVMVGPQVGFLLPGNMATEMGTRI